MSNILEERVRSRGASILELIVVVGAVVLAVILIMQNRPGNSINCKSIAPTVAATFSFRASGPFIRATSESNFEAVPTLPAVLTSIAARMVSELDAPDTRADAGIYAVDSLGTITVVDKRDQSGANPGTAPTSDVQDVITSVLPAGNSSYYYLSTTIFCAPPGDTIPDGSAAKRVQATFGAPSGPFPLPTAFP